MHKEYVFNTFKENLNFIFSMSSLIFKAEKQRQLGRFQEKKKQLGSRTATDGTPPSPAPKKLRWAVIAQVTAWYSPKLAHRTQRPPGRKGHEGEARNGGGGIMAARNILRGAACGHRFLVPVPSGALAGSGSRSIGAVAQVCPFPSKALKLGFLC